MLGQYLPFVDLGLVFVANTVLKFAKTGPENLKMRIHLFVLRGSSFLVNSRSHGLSKYIGLRHCGEAAGLLLFRQLQLLLELRGSLWSICER